MVEFCLGVYFLFGICRRMIILFVVFIMGVMILFILWLVFFNLILDCGCFGDVVILINWEIFGKNVFLLIVVVFVFKWGNCIIFLVIKCFDWLVVMYMFFYILGMILYCYCELFVFDFCFYYIGVDICKGMEILEGEKFIVYEICFIF